MLRLCDQTRLGWPCQPHRECKFCDVPVMILRFVEQKGSRGLAKLSSPRRVPFRPTLREAVFVEALSSRLPQTCGVKGVGQRGIGTE